MSSGRWAMRLPIIACPQQQQIGSDNLSNTPIDLQDCVKYTVFIHRHNNNHIPGSISCRFTRQQTQLEHDDDNELDRPITSRQVTCIMTDEKTTNPKCCIHCSQSYCSQQSLQHHQQQCLMYTLTPRDGWLNGVEVDPRPAGLVLRWVTVRW